MLRRILRHAVTIGGSLILTAVVFFGMAVWRRSDDTKWCRQATATSALPEAVGPVAADLLEQQRSACTIQRQRQRVMFGTVWRKGGPEMAECGFEYARLQLVADQGPEVREAVLKEYGLDDSDFDTSSGEDRDRFVETCLSKVRQEAR